MESLCSDVEFSEIGHGMVSDYDLFNSFMTEAVII